MSEDFNDDLMAPISAFEKMDLAIDEMESHKPFDEGVATETLPDLEPEIRKLERVWGPRDNYHYRSRMLIAEWTAHKVLSVRREALDKIQDAIGYAEISLLFHQIGVALGVGFNIKPLYYTD